MDTYKFLLEHRNNWTKLSGGISNDVYKYDSYIIKILKHDDRLNNLDNYIAYLIKSPYYVYFDPNTYIYVEHYIDGGIIENNMLYDKTFFKNKLIPLIDNINNLTVDISKTNIIKIYIQQYRTIYQTIKNSNSNNDAYDAYHTCDIYDTYDDVYIDLLLNDLDEYFQQEKLCYNHMDIQKYNLLGKDNEIILIDYEYAGYTWKYIDHANFICLLHIDTDKYIDINIDDYLILLKEIYNVDELIILKMMLIMSYIWLYWTNIKIITTEDSYYVLYKNLLSKVYDKVYIKLNRLVCE